MNQTKRIALLICYFGKFPWYFDYFVHSCRYNQTIDFFIICDDITYTKLLPANIRLIYKTLNDVSDLATVKLGFRIDIRQPYKLCDFKPTYGLLFNELIEGYDFWGYGDVDVIFGDIRHFITNELLSEFDIISVRHDFLTGYFQLFRNNHKMINLFRWSKDFVKVLSSDKHFCFDETNFQFQAFSNEVPLNQIDSEIESMMHVVRKLEARKYIIPYFDFHVIEGLPGKLKWSCGKLFYKDRYEVILYHLILFKKQYTPKTDIKFIPESFTISSTKIYHAVSSKTTVDEL